MRGLGIVFPSHGWRGGGRGRGRFRRIVDYLALTGEARGFWGAYFVLGFILVGFRSGGFLLADGGEISDSELASVVHQRPERNMVARGS